MELGRNSSRTDGGGTKAMPKETRFVGFEHRKLASASDTGNWNINDHGELCYDGNPLETQPTPGLNMYDTTPRADGGIRSVHLGNPVIDSRAAKLPAGIEAKHLMLLANEAQIRGQDIDFTDSAGKVEGGPTPVSKEAGLSDAMKAQVADLFPGKTFAEISDVDILMKLHEQAGELGHDVNDHWEDVRDSSLDDVRGLEARIQDEIEDGSLVPSTELTSAVQGVSEATTEMSTTTLSGGEQGVERAQALHSAVEHLSDVAQSAQGAGLGDAAAAASQASESLSADAARYATAADTYSAMSDATSLEAYDEAMRGPAEAPNPTGEPGIG